MRKLSLIISVAILTLLIAWWLLPSQQAASDDITDDDDFIKAIMEEAHIPGLAISIIKSNQIYLQQGYGFSNVDSQQLVTANTPFNIASISKPIMGISLLQLVDQGLLDLDRDLNNYLPFTLDNPHIQGETMTLRQLSAHAASIKDFYDPDTFSRNRDPEMSLGEFVQQSLSSEGRLYNQGAYFFADTPGSMRDYSNLSAALAGYLVELVSPDDLIAVNKKHLLEPLGMNSTGWRVADFDLNQVATPYTGSYCIPLTPVCAGPESPKIRYAISTIFNPAKNSRGFISYDHFGYPDYPAGGLRSTVTDLTRLVQMIFNHGELNGHRYLSETMFEEMFSLQLPNDISTRQRFFWRDNPNGLIGHQGSDPGVYSRLYFDLEKQDAVIILVNRSPDNKMNIALDRIQKRLLDR